MISFDDVQERRDERDMHFGTTADHSVTQNFFCYRANAHRLRSIASGHFQGENFRQLIEQCGDAEVYLVLGKRVIGYGQYLSEAGEMARKKGIEPGDCMCLFRPRPEINWA